MPQYQEILRGQISPQKNLVISRRQDGFLSIAQQFVFTTESGPMTMFAKNAIVVEIDSLREIHRLIGEAIGIIDRETKRS